METCDYCGKEVNQNELNPVSDKWFCCNLCLGYYGYEELEEKTNYFSEIKAAIKSGYSVYWRNHFYPVKLNKSGDLYIMARNGNMQYVTPDYNSDDFKVEDSK